MNEAKYSANVRANLRGYDVQITARSDGEDDLLEVLVAMVEELDRVGATPERRWENGKPVNGNGSAETKAVPPAKPPQPAPAARMAAAPLLPVEASATAPLPAPKPETAAKPAPKPAAAKPYCQECNVPDNMEFIRWKDKETGKPRAAWKCQKCQAWLREPR